MANNTLLTGSICLSDIPRDVMRKVKCRDGKERIYLNISIVERKSPQTFANGSQTRTYTHFVSCQPKKEERKEGVNYIIGDIETRVFGNTQVSTPSVEDVMAAPPVSSDDPLPF